MDGIASVRHEPDILSRQAMMYLPTMGRSLAHTSLAITPEHSASNGENVMRHKHMTEDQMVLTRFHLQSSSHSCSPGVSSRPIPIDFSCRPHRVLMLQLWSLRGHGQLGMAAFTVWLGGCIPEALRQRDRHQDLKARESTVST